MKTTALRSSLNGKLFENEAFQMGWCYDNLLWDLLVRFFRKHKSKMAVVCCVVNFLQRSVKGKHLMCFQSENAVYLKLFLRCSDNATLMQCPPGQHSSRAICISSSVFMAFLRGLM